MRLLISLSLIFSCISMYAHENAFVVHLNRYKPVCFYETDEFRHPVLKTYPNSEGAGIMLEIRGTVKNGFRVIVNNDIYYVKVGFLAVNPRGEIISFFESPDMGGDNIEIAYSVISGPLMIYDWCDGWVKTIINVNGTRISGWVHPQNQCPSPYTTCP